MTSNDSGESEASGLAGPQRGLRLSPLLLAALTLSACSQRPIDPSPESEFLQNRLIPEMIRWAGTNSDVLPLGPRLSPQGFDYVCTLPGYEALARLEAEVPITHYRGHVDAEVPESKIAVIGIKGTTAHVAYVWQREFSLYNPGRNCVIAQRASLSTSRGSDRYSPGAFLQEN